MNVSQEDVLQYFRGNNTELQVTHERDKELKGSIYKAVLETQGPKEYARINDLWNYLHLNSSDISTLSTMDNKDNTFKITISSRVASTILMTYEGCLEPGKEWNKIIFLKEEARAKFEELVKNKKDVKSIAIVM